MTALSDGELLDMVAASPVAHASSADVWDGWSVRADTLAETTTAALRAADDPMGTTETGRDWSARLDQAVHRLDEIDPDRLDAWIHEHATSASPEIYEARLVAMWESRHPGDDLNE